MEEKNAAKPKRKGGFVKGDPRAGRPLGVKNKTTTEVRELAGKLIEDPDYVANLRARLLLGEATHMEPILWYYRYGKPKETVEVEFDLSKAPDAVIDWLMNNGSGK